MVPKSGFKLPKRCFEIAFMIVTVIMAHVSSALEYDCATDELLDSNEPTIENTVRRLLTEVGAGEIETFECAGRLQGTIHSSLFELTSLRKLYAS